MERPGYSLFNFWKMKFNFWNMSMRKMVSQCKKAKVKLGPGTSLEFISRSLRTECHSNFHPGHCIHTGTSWR